MGIKLLLLSITFVFIAGVAAQAPFRKYDVKSAIVTFHTDMKIGTMEFKDSIKVYFDDYGIKECKETYYHGRLATSFFSDGKNRYLVDHERKTATNQGPAYSGTELRVDSMEFSTQKGRDEGKIKKAPAMKVAGKACEVFVSDDGQGGITTYGGWNKVLLYLDVETKSVRNTLRAVKVRENAKVPAEKFAVPAGYKIE